MKSKKTNKRAHEPTSTTKKYTRHYRTKVLEYAEAISIRAASKEFGVPEGTIQVWRHRLRKLTGNIPQSQDQKPTNKETSGNHFAVDSGTTPPSKGRVTGCPAKGRRYPPKLRAEILEYAEANSVGEASREYSVASGTIYSWRDQARRKAGHTKLPEANEAGVSQAVPFEQKTEMITPEDRDQAVLKVWRRNQGLGPSQIKNMLKRAGWKLSVATVRNIMAEHGYVPPKMKAKEHQGRYEATRPRELYHLDFYHFHVHKQKQVLLFILDDFSRFIAGWALVKSENADAVIDAFERAIAQYGKPERAMSDRGSAFHSWKGLSRFERMLEDYEINFHLAQEPQTNGKVEALNAAFQKECLRHHEFLDLTDASRAIGKWVERFNHFRTHHGLGGVLVPADRFYGLADRTLKMIELGHGADALDILNPEGRGLEIFRVVSYGGNPQVFLMGKKIVG